MGPVELKTLLRAQGLLLIFLLIVGGGGSASGQMVAEKIPLGELKMVLF